MKYFGCRTLIGCMIAVMAVALSGCGGAGSGGDKGTPITGRGVPVSAATTSYAAPSPVSIKINMRPGTATRVIPRVNSVYRDGQPVSTSLVRPRSGTYRPNGPAPRIELAIKSGAPAGIYVVRFICQNEDRQRMPEHVQRIRHGMDAAAAQAGVPVTGRGVPVSAWNPEGSPSKEPFGPGQVSVPVHLAAGTHKGTQWLHTIITRVEFTEQGRSPVEVPWTSVLLRRPSSIEHDSGSMRAAIAFYVKHPEQSKVAKGDYTIHFHCVNEDGEKGDFKGGTLQVKIE